MPSTVFIRFDIPSEIVPTPRRMHAALGRVLDLPEGVDPQRAARLPSLAHRPPHDRPGPKPYCLGEMMMSSASFGVELRFLDDRLLDTLDAWLAWGGVLPVGDGGDGDAVLAAVEAQILEQAEWEELAADDGATAWNIRLLTPTVFTTRGQHQATTNPASLATSLHARWREWGLETMPELPAREQLERVLATVDHTRPVEVNLGMPRKDGRGRLSSRSITARDGELRVTGVTGARATAVFSQLMALSRFTNVGSHTAYGMGVVDVVADPV